jgi:hypothetical protein
MLKGPFSIHVTLFPRPAVRQARIQSRQRIYRSTASFRIALSSFQSLPRLTLGTVIQTARAIHGNE